MQGITHLWYFYPSLKYYQYTVKNVKIHTQYKWFAMKNILIELVLTNMAAVGKMTIKMMWKIMTANYTILSEGRGQG